MIFTTLVAKHRHVSVHEGSALWGGVLPSDSGGGGGVCLLRGLPSGEFAYWGGVCLLMGVCLLRVCLLREVCIKADFTPPPAPPPPPPPPHLGGRQRIREYGQYAGSTHPTRMHSSCLGVKNEFHNRLTEEVENNIYYIQCQCGKFR